MNYTNLFLIIRSDGIGYKLINKNTDHQYFIKYIVSNEHSVIILKENGKMLVDELQLSSEQ